MCVDIIFFTVNEFLCGSNHRWEKALKNFPVNFRVGFVVSLIFENLSLVSVDTSTLFVVAIFDPMYSPALLTPEAVTLPI